MICIAEEITFQSLYFFFSPHNLCISIFLFSVDLLILPEIKSPVILLISVGSVIDQKKTRVVFYFYCISYKQAKQ